MRDPRSVVITGASSGIGEALARGYAAPGFLLGLTGRDAKRLESVAAACREQGADVVADTVDVTDADAMARFLQRVAGKRPLGLVIANAGISAGTGKGTESAEQSRRILATNLDGVLNTLYPAIELMRQRPAETGSPRGQLAIMSSLASFRGFPGAPAYCASKAAVRILGEALRGELHAHGIELSVIVSGYVRTRLTSVNDFYMPQLMDADRAARIIRRGLARNRARIAYPRFLYALTRLFSSLPPALTDPLVRGLPRKD